MSGDDVEAREAALVAWAPARECNGHCSRCEAFRAGWDDAQRGMLSGSMRERYGESYADGYEAARAYARAQAKETT